MDVDDFQIIFWWVENKENEEKGFYPTSNDVKMVKIIQLELKKTYASKMKKNEVIQVNVVERIVVLTVTPGSYKMMINDVKTVVGEIWRYPKNPKKIDSIQSPFQNQKKNPTIQKSPSFFNFFHGKSHGFPHFLRSPRPSPGHPPGPGPS